MSACELQPDDGANPPAVFNRCMKVVFVSSSPPVGPAKVPTALTRSQAIEPGLTKFGSVEEPSTRPQTVLVSRECCQVARMTPFSNGLGLKKWVVTCSTWPLNKVACGVNNVKATPFAQPGLLGSQGRQL